MKTTKRIAKFIVDRGIAKSMAEFKGGQTFGPFDTHEKFLAAINKEARKGGRARFFKQLRAEAPEWLKERWKESKRAGTDKLTMRQINAEIAAVRRELAEKKQPPK